MPSPTVAHTAAVAAAQQIPLTSLFERRMAYFIKPADDWLQLGTLVGEQVSRGADLPHHPGTNSFSDLHANSLP